MPAYDFAMTEAAALSEGVRRCAMTGQGQRIANSDGEIVWSIEPDTKVDNEDLTYPVIVHMRGGTIESEGIALLIPEDGD